MLFIHREVGERVSYEIVRTKQWRTLTLRAGKIEEEESDVRQRRWI